ncbi:hypothetical protein GQ600_3678 [Phytophthora cactorum]|nr:hypothetical protein GQ600_3678 [Phytophthora cactorum]
MCSLKVASVDQSEHGDIRRADQISSLFVITVLLLAITIEITTVYDLKIRNTPATHSARRLKARSGAARDRREQLTSVSTYRSKQPSFPYKTFPHCLSLAPPLPTALSRNHFDASTIPDVVRYYFKVHTIKVASQGLTIYNCKKCPKSSKNAINTGYTNLRKHVRNCFGDKEDNT